MSRKKREYDLSIIVAVDETGGYANRHGIPWSFEADWKHFKKITNGNVCVMGRKTYQDIAYRRKIRNPNFRVLLPGRESYLISTTRDEAQGVKVHSGVSHVVEELPEDNREVYLLGGFRLWVQHWYDIRQIWMTIVPGTYETTKKFPVEWLNTDYEIVEGHKEETEKGELMFVKYVRKVKYLTFQFLRPHLKEQIANHFKQTGRLIRNDPYNNTITIINPSADEKSEIKRAGGRVTDRKAGLIK